MARNPGVLTKNPNVIKWVDEMVALTKPDQVVWIDGSKEQLAELTDEVCSLPDGNKDKMYRLNPEKPPVPKSNLASMGIYIFNWDILKKYLEEDEADPNSKNDFGMNIIPALLRDGRKMYAYHFNGYWRDVGTIDSLWEANMEVLDPENSGIDIFDEKWKIYSRNPVLPAQKIGPRAVVQDSLVTEGCQIYGCVKHSVLSAGVVVEEGATVEDAVLMDGVVVKAGAVVKRCILAENVVVGAGAKIGGDGPIAHVGTGLTIGAGATVKEGAKVFDSVKEGEEVC